MDVRTPQGTWSRALVPQRPGNPGPFSHITRFTVLCSMRPWGHRHTLLDWGRLARGWWPGDMEAPGIPADAQGRSREVGSPRQVKRCTMPATCSVCHPAGLPQGKTTQTRGQPHGAGDCTAVPQVGSARTCNPMPRFSDQLGLLPSRQAACLLLWAPHRFPK